MKRLTDKELEVLAEKVWKESRSWNLTYKELTSISYSHGPDGRGPVSGVNDSLSDTVYTSPEGHEMSRLMCSDLMKEYSAFLDGFVKAYKILKEMNDGKEK